MEVALEGVTVDLPEDALLFPVDADVRLVRRGYPHPLDVFAISEVVRRKAVVVEVHGLRVVDSHQRVVAAAEVDHRVRDLVTRAYVAVEKSEVRVFHLETRSGEVEADVDRLRLVELEVKAVAEVELGRGQLDNLDRMASVEELFKQDYWHDNV